jgi:hypothetical protein
MLAGTHSETISSGRIALVGERADVVKDAEKETGKELHRRILADAMRNADIVLAHVVENQGACPDETASIIKMSAILSSGHRVSPVQELQFWSAYSKLADRLKPATVSEVVIYHQSQGKHFSFKNYVLTGITVGLVTFAMLLSLFYMTDGTLLAKQLEAYLNCIQQGPSAAIADSSPADDQTSTTTDAASKVNCVTVTDDKPVISDSGRPSETIVARPHQYFVVDEMGYSLYAWRHFYFFAPYSKTKYLAKKLRETNSFTLANYQHEKAKVQLQLFNFWILPCLLGTLGALTQAVRAISGRLSERRGLLKTDTVQYFFSVLLGAAGAIVVGVFSSSRALPSTLAAVPPLILAFLVGYNANLVFSLIDAMIDNLRGAFAKK